jgi:hypothetical protein
MRRRSFVVAVLVLIVFWALVFSGQEKPTAGAAQASVPSTKQMIDIEPLKLKNAVWSATTDPSKPNVVKVMLDLRQLSVLQGVYNVRCTVKLTDQHTHATKTETYSMGLLEGGSFYVKEFKTHLKAADWKRVQVEGEKLEGDLSSHVYASQPAERKPTI